MSENYIEEEDAIYGYKLVHRDMTPCYTDIKYEVGKTYSIPRIDGSPNIVCCKNGYHMCTYLPYCYRYYGLDSRLLYVKGWGEYQEGDDKYAFEHMQIIKELNVADMLEEDEEGELYLHAYHLRQINASTLINRIKELCECGSECMYVESLDNFTPADYMLVCMDNGWGSLLDVLAHDGRDICSLLTVIQTCASICYHAFEQKTFYRRSIPLVKQRVIEYTGGKENFDEYDNETWFGFMNGVNDNAIYKICFDRDTPTN